jgi:agmatine/peptidylarginine deiminase
MNAKNYGRLKTDYENCKYLFLAYPEGVKDADEDYNGLINFYNDLIRKIPRNIEVKLIVRNKEIGERVKKLRRKLDYIVNSELRTIWLRDIIGFLKGFDLIKPTFRPKYYWGAFEVATQINENIKFIHSLLNLNLKDLPLVWDGGNLVTNGKIGFLSERILIDNAKQYSEKQVSEIIKQFLNIEPIYIPELKGDDISHSDGFMAFLSENTIAIADYSNKKGKHERDHLKAIKRIVSRQELEVVYLQDFPETVFEKDIPTAIGGYANFLQLNNHIIMPTFNNPKLDTYNHQLLKKYGKVIDIDCTELGKYGGLLHCISWCI